LANAIHPIKRLFTNGGLGGRWKEMHDKDATEYEYYSAEGTRIMKVKQSVITIPVTNMKETIIMLIKTETQAKYVKQAGQILQLAQEDAASDYPFRDDDTKNENRVTIPYVLNHSGITIYAGSDCAEKALCFQEGVRTTFQKPIRTANDSTLSALCYQGSGKQRGVLNYFLTGNLTVTGPNHLKQKILDRLPLVLAPFFSPNTTIQMEDTTPSRMENSRLPPQTYSTPPRPVTFMGGPEGAGGDSSAKRKLSAEPSGSPSIKVALVGASSSSSSSSSSSPSPFLSPAKPTSISVAPQLSPGTESPAAKEVKEARIETSLVSDDDDDPAPTSVRETLDLSPSSTSPTRKEYDRTEQEGGNTPPLSSLTEDTIITMNTKIDTLIEQLKHKAQNKEEFEDVKSRTIRSILQIAVPFLLHNTHVTDNLLITIKEIIKEIGKYTNKKTVNWHTKQVGERLKQAAAIVNEIKDEDHGFRTPKAKTKTTSLSRSKSTSSISGQHSTPSLTHPSASLLSELEIKNTLITGMAGRLDSLEITHHLNVAALQEQISKAYDNGRISLHEHRAVATDVLELQMKLTEIQGLLKALDGRVAKMAAERNHQVRDASTDDATVLTKGRLQRGEDERRAMRVEINGLTAERSASHTVEDDRITAIEKVSGLIKEKVARLTLDMNFTASKDMLAIAVSEMGAALKAQTRSQVHEILKQQRDLAGPSSTTHPPLAVSYVKTEHAMTEAQDPAQGIKRQRDQDRDDGRDKDSENDKDSGKDRDRGRDRDIDRGRDRDRDKTKARDNSSASGHHNSSTSQNSQHQNNRNPSSNSSNSSGSSGSGGGHGQGARGGGKGGGQQHRGYGNNNNNYSNNNNTNSNNQKHHNINNQQADNRQQHNINNHQVTSRQGNNQQGNNQQSNNQQGNNQQRTAQQDEDTELGSEIDALLGPPPPPTFFDDSEPFSDLEQEIFMILRQLNWKSKDDLNKTIYGFAASKTSTNPAKQFKPKIAVSTMHKYLVSVSARIDDVKTAVIQLSNLKVGNFDHKPRRKFAGEHKRV